MRRFRTRFRRVRVLLYRLPKNLRSNRWWIIWNSTLYIRSQKTTLLPDESGPLPDLAKATASRSESYVRWQSLFSKEPILSGSHGALFLPEMGMFGNMTRRLAAGLVVGDALSIGHVVVPSSAEFQGDIFLRGVHQVSPTQTLWLFAEERARNPVRVLHKINFLVGPPLSHPALIPSIKRSWAALFSLLIPHPRGAPLPAAHLVFHIRGGDVFGPRRPPSYGQPPLVYYTAIIDSAPWRAVTVVSSDLLNPTVTPLIDFCRKKNIPVEFQSGSLAEDLSVLLTATTLVTGRGTFMPAVCGLSRAAKKIYYFEDKFSLYPPVPGLEIIRVGDVTGEYVLQVLSNNWQNSPIQRELMLSYPSENISIEQ